MCDLDSNGLPIREGVYLIEEDGWGNKEIEIDVYEYEPKGSFCCFSEDFGSGGTGIDDKHDCHVSVQFSGLEFVKRVRGLD